MKKIMIILGFSAALLACSKITEPVDSSVSDSPITLNLSIGSGSPDTKSIKTDWAHGDKVHIFFADYVNSDYQYLTVAYDKTGSVTGTKYTWYVHTWHGGLEKKLRPATSGKLSAIYCPNDKVEGSISVLILGGSEQYTITPKDRNGKDFNSYYSYDDDVTYTIDKSGVLSATICLKTPGTYTQYCIQRDRNGEVFTNADSDHYTLQVADERYDSPSSKIHEPSFNGPSNAISNTLQVATYLSAYFYGGLCFSDVRHGTGKSMEQTLIFVFNDNRGDKNTTNDKKYVYSVKYKYFMHTAVKLPDLNAIDANGNYLWREL